MSKKIIIDEKRSEILLAGILEHLENHWVFREKTIQQSNQARLVDVLATNQSLVLHENGLEDYISIGPEDERVIKTKDYTPLALTINPKRIAIILLCGGLGTRSKGKINPLLKIKLPGKKCTMTILEMHLKNLANSPLSEATSLIMGSVFNEKGLKEEIEKHQYTKKTGLYIGGLTPRLSLYQTASGPPILYKNKTGELSYNPSGHYDALRWLIISGTFTRLKEIELILIASYSNWGSIFNEETLNNASFALECWKNDQTTLFVTEVVPRPREKHQGSILVARSDDPKRFNLIKHGYGTGKLNLSDYDEVLMSSNTHYFIVPSIIKRLLKVSSTIGIESTRTALFEFLSNAQKKEISALFDLAFPVKPLLTIKKSDEGIDVIQAERDIDQLSLMKGISSMKPIMVGEKRAISIKHPKDLVKIKEIFSS